MADAAAQLPGEDAKIVRRWCVWWAVGLVFLGSVLNCVYLFNHCPLDLSEDESHYWEWSRHLDYGYYSKPPGIAWVIAVAVKTGAALGISGDGSGAALMPVVRMPAVFFGLLSGLLSLFLARRMFRDDRAAISVIALCAAVPMFAVGSLLITIDSPMYLCWAATVYCLWRCVEGEEMTNDERRKTKGVGWLYLSGLACGLGMLFKPVLIAIPICSALAAWKDLRIRRALKTWHSVGALLVAALSYVPMLIWNSQHGWVMLHHMLTQGGMEAGAETKYNPLGWLGEYVGGQAGGMAGIMFVLLIIGVVMAFKKTRVQTAEASPAKPGAMRTQYVFLLSFTLPLWLFYLVMNLKTKTEVNWPAASYFTGMILLAGVFVEGWNSAVVKVRKAWRVWGTIAIAWGVLMTAAAMNFQRLYPMVAEKLAPIKGTDAYFKSWWHPLKWDQPMVRLRGLQDRAAIVQRAAESLKRETGQDPLIITSRYDTSSSLAFYMPGHPFVFSIMSSVGGRQSQYDIWPGVNQRESGKLIHEGQPAVIIGSFEPWAIDGVLKKSFDRVEGPELVSMEYLGVVLKDVVIWRGYGFKGMPVGKGGVY